MEVALAYDHRTSFAMTLTDLALNFAANIRRQPVAFSGRVKDPVLLRQLLIGLHRNILSDLRWHDPDEWRRILDPVITVHHDQIFFEAFSADQSSYARLSAPLDAFEVEGETRYGTTNIDFNAGLLTALQNLRSSRRTSLRVGAGGLGVATTIGAATLDHFERKVDVPDEWVKGFLQVQGALAIRPFVFDVPPEDLLTLIAYFQENKPPSLPHGLRYELRPDQPIAAVLEPWDKRFTLRGTPYTGYERTVRVWGRQRLALLLDVLPYADRVTVGVLGRGLPHLYVCHCGPYRFTLVLSGWTRQDWATDAAFDLLAPRVALDPQRADRVYAYLGEHLAAKASEIAANTSVPAREVEQALFQLCRAGRAMVDPISGRYRLRELFGDTLDMRSLFAPDPRLAVAEGIVAASGVTLRDVTDADHDPKGRHEARADATVRDPSGATYEAAVAVDETGRLRFGRCECPFFQVNLISRGPCEHLLAATLALGAGQAAEVLTQESA
jgi:hypothetical protein